MTAEQLEELLGKVTQGEWDNFEGEDGFWFIEAERGMFGESVAGDALEYDAALIALAPYLARRVLAAEKLVEALEQCRDELMSAYHSEFDGVWLESDFKEVAGKYDALAAYRDASK